MTLASTATRNMDELGAASRDLVITRPLRPHLNRFIIAPQLERIFDYRQERLARGPGQPPA